MTIEDAKQIAHGLIQGYIGPDHRVMDMPSFYFGFVGTLIAQALVACGVGSTTTKSIRKSFPAIQARQDDTKCRSLGFNPGTEGYKQCRLRLKTQGSHDPLL